MSDPGYTILSPEDGATSATDKFAIDVLVGLSDSPKKLSSRYFYDDEGSRLFQSITETEDYYPTRKEFEIFHNHGKELLSSVAGKAINLVDLGAGDGRKTKVLLSQLEEVGCDVTYVPIDISEGAMQGLVASMRTEFPKLKVAGVVSEYFEGIEWLSRQSGRQNLVLFLGSNIGNFNRPLARAFLHRLWSALNEGDLAMIGFDMKKDIEVLLNAYNDNEGVTAAFNLNLLARINNELGGNFELSKFRHFSTYNVISGAMESYLVSLEAQRVHIKSLRAAFEFKPWEAIHTEFSYKYLDSDVDEMAKFTGFEVVDRRYDEQRWFCDALWKVNKLNLS